MTLFLIYKFNIADIDNMFKTFGSRINGCKHLLHLNISSFDTSNITNMMFMFGGCLNLESLDLLNFNTKNVTNKMECLINAKIFLN